MVGEGRRRVVKIVDTQAGAGRELPGMALGNSLNHNRILVMLVCK